MKIEYKKQTQLLGLGVYLAPRIDWRWGFGVNWVLNVDNERCVWGGFSDRKVEGTQADLQFGRNIGIPICSTNPGHVDFIFSFYST